MAAAYPDHHRRLTCATPADWETCIAFQARDTAKRVLQLNAESLGRHVIRQVWEVTPAPANEQRPFPIGDLWIVLQCTIAFNQELEESAYLLVAVSGLG
jgi:hypothetical protein